MIFGIFDKQSNRAFKLQYQQSSKESLRRFIQREVVEPDDNSRFLIKISKNTFIFCITEVHLLNRV